MSKTEQEDTEEAPNPFNPARYRRSPHLDDGNIGRKKRITIAARKPSKYDWVRVHPDPQQRAECSILELKDGMETEYHLVDQDIAEAHLQGFAFNFMVFRAVDTLAVEFLWLARMPRSGRRPCRWHTTALEAAEFAMEHWTNVVANERGYYDFFPAEREVPEPQWSTLTLDEMLEIAFKGFVINDEESPIIKRIRMR